MTLYDQTSEDNAKSILNRGFIPGVWGIAGPAIYFATTPNHTHHKARFKGIILECVVDLGKLKMLGQCGDPSLTKEIMKNEGFDSVQIPRDKGIEYAIYENTRVKHIKIYKTNT